MNAPAFIVRDERFNCRLGELTVLRFRRRLHVCNLGPAAARGEAPAVGAAASLMPADTSIGDGVLLRSAPISAAKRISLEGGRLRYVPRCYRRYFIELDGRGFDDYLAGFSSKSRSTLRRKLKRFEQASDGAVDFREYRRPGDMEEFFRHARDISRHTYQELMFDMGLPADGAFKAAMEQAAAQGRVRAYLLFLQGRAVAYLYCPCIDGVVEYQYLGYLPEFKHLSPGTVLLLRAFETLFDDPEARVFDFTEGGKEGGHKDFFADGSRECADIYLLRPTPANIALVLAHFICDRLSAQAGRLLERLHLKRRIKSALRLAKGSAA